MLATQAMLCLVILAWFSLAKLKEKKLTALTVVANSYPPDPLSVTLESLHTETAE